MFDLAGKRALVTGASGGIGGAIARALHRQGAVVALSGTRREALDNLAGELCDGAHVTPCDLSDDAAVAALAKDAADAMGGLDIIVNNAGITRDGLAMRMSDDDWGDVLNVNLTAGFRIVRAALRGMMKQRWGRVISITSVVGATGNSGQANYAAAKAGTVGMTKALAAEVARRGITANCIAPGMIETAMTEALGDAAREAMTLRIPLGRPGTPDDVASSAVFLASDEAAYITGHTLHVNGGLAMI
ncbi:MAG: 3-oxoacyl-[acyl-carrier-protein] reductase [Alphaproteobacteria bacterium]